MPDAAVPAFIFCDPQMGSLRIAALTLLDRLVVALHRAGCAPIQIQCAGPLPSLKRSQALHIEVEQVDQCPKSGAEHVWAHCSCLVQAADVKRLLQHRGRLRNAQGQDLPIGWTSSFCQTAEETFQGSSTVVAEAVAELVTDAESAVRAERILWDSLVSQTDGKVDVYFNRPLGRPLSKILIHTPITPNQITLSALVVGLASAWCFSRGDYALSVWGALLLQLSAVIDCIDGDIARIVFKESRLGKWLDLGADQVVHVCLFGGIAAGLASQGAGGPVLALGLSAVVGAVLSFAVVLRGMFLPASQRPARLQQLIDSATSRDFSVLLLGLAVAGRVDWFLWMTAIGVHVFWLTALALQCGQAAPRQEQNQPGR